MRHRSRDGASNSDSASEAPAPRPFLPALWRLRANIPSVIAIPSASAKTAPPKTAPPERTNRVGIEIKRTTAPKVTRSVNIAIADLQLVEAIVVHAGKQSYRLAERVRAVAAGRLAADLGLDDFCRA